MPYEKNNREICSGGGGLLQPAGKERTPNKSAENVKKRGHANRHSLYLGESELIKNCGQDLPNDGSYYGKDHRSQASAAL